MAPDLSSVIKPRVLIVSRRTVRKNKFVNFVGEYHLDLIVSYGAAPVIVPRVAGVHTLLESFEPIHGVLLCEGEDIDPSHYDSAATGLSPQDLDEIRRLHPGDAAVDEEKDSIELALANLCLHRKIPYLGICRGSQILNVACGGTLYQDIGKELHSAAVVVHMNYDNYDGHRHPVSLVENTPLHAWFRDSARGPNMEISVNSYHHQGVKKLASRFVPMAFAADGLIEGFYDPDNYDPEEGKFLVGLQFHPERMRNQDTDDFDYPGCASAYQEFVKAVIAYEKKANGELEKKSSSIVRMARNMYDGAATRGNANSGVLETGAELLVANMEMRVTAKIVEEKEKVARVIIAKMSPEQLSDAASYYHNMARICSEVLENKQLGSAA